MPRSNRYILPGYTYHLTHRCHNKEFLFKFAKDRTEYRNRMRLALSEFSISMLTYCITSNHTHLLVQANEPDSISKFMQKLEGEFAELYNIRKKRSGAFWAGRFHCTMIDSGEYLWNCMKYIDLNMVRAGVVAHPADWDWCGYRELVGLRKRYCVLDMEKVLNHYNSCSNNEFVLNYKHVIQNAINTNDLKRDPAWAQSIAVGSESFIEEVQANTKNRSEFKIENTSNKWSIKETVPLYEANP